MHSSQPRLSPPTKYEPCLNKRMNARRRKKRQLTRITRLLSMNPFCIVLNTVPSSLPAIGAMKLASCRLGLNASPVSAGSKRSSPCFARVCMSTFSVILSPSYKLIRSLFDPVPGALLRPSASSSGSLTCASGTMERARSRLSTLSTRSRAKREMAKSRAAATSRAVRSCRLRKSATERRYLSYGAICVSRLHVVPRHGMFEDTFKSIISRPLSSISFRAGSSASAETSEASCSLEIPADGCDGPPAFAEAVSAVEA